MKRLGQYPCIRVFSYTLLCSVLWLWACPGQPKPPRPALGTLNEVLTGVAATYRLTPLSPPISGIKPAWVYSPDGLLQTGCWQTAERNFRSLSDVTVHSSDSSGGNLNFGLRVLSLIGIGLSGGSERIQTVDLTLTGWSISQADGLSFNWDSSACWQELRKHALPVVQKVLQFGSINVQVTTETGKHITLDSATLHNTSVNFRLSGGWGMSRNGTVEASGDSLAVGYVSAPFAVQEFRCPIHGTFPLGPAQPLRLMDGCPGGESWYRVQLLKTIGDTLRVKFQEAGPSGRVWDSLVVIMGQEFNLASDPRSRDRAVIQSSGDQLGLLVSRYDIGKATLGVLTLPMSRDSAKLPIRF